MTKTLCESCKINGLPILPVRYTVLPTNVARLMPPGITGKGVTDVKLTEHSYGVRIVRAGWLYLFYEKGARGNNYWEAYAISDMGRLMKYPIPLPTVGVTPALGDCDTSKVPTRADIFVIEKPLKCGTVWIAYSEFQWHSATFDKYKNDAALRAKRMQSIQPAAWANSGTDSSGHATKATAGVIETIVEYNPAFNATRLQYSDKDVVTTHPLTGEYDPALVKEERTRYTLNIRQMTPGSATDQLLKVMTDAGANPQGTPLPPMIMALWDGIGITHELNGFRNDPVVWLGKYTTENAALITTSDCISSAEKAVKAGAVKTASEHREFWQSFKENLVTGMEAAGTGGYTPLPTNDTDLAEQQKRIADAGKLSAADTQKAETEKWSNYTKELKNDVLDAFKSQYASLQRYVESLQSHRAADVGAWLAAPLFRNTLNDYYDQDICDGKAYEAVISDAFYGLTSESLGANIAFSYFQNMDPLDPASLFWSAFAYNQADAKQEIKQALDQAQAHKQDVINDSEEKLAPAFSVIGSVIKNLKNFIKQVKDARDRIDSPERISVVERLTNDKSDRLMMSAGNLFVRAAGIGYSADRVGTYIMQSASILRLGVTPQDTLTLIRENMETIPSIWDNFKKTYSSLRNTGLAASEAFYKTLGEISTLDLMQQRELHLTFTNSAEKLIFTKRAASTLAILQTVSFIFVLGKADKKAEDYALIAASALTTISLFLTIPVSIAEVVAEDAKTTILKLKALAGYAGSAAAVISFGADAYAGSRETRNGPWMAKLSLYGKLGLDMMTTAGTVITTLTFAAPYVAFIFGKTSKIAILVTKVNASTASVKAGNKVAKLLKGSAGEGLSDAAKSREIQTATSKAFSTAVTDIGVNVGAEVISAEGASLLLARFALFAAGWEVMVAITIISFLYDWFKNDDLQEWMIECPFGTNPKNNDNKAEKLLQKFTRALPSASKEGFLKTAL